MRAYILFYFRKKKRIQNEQNTERKHFSTWITGRPHGKTN